MESKRTISEIMEEVFVLSPLDKKDLIRKTLKLGEEYGELAEAVLSSEGSHGCTYKGKTKQDVLEEGADVIIVALSVLEKAGFKKEDVEHMLDRKIFKWLSKIQDETQIQDEAQ